MTGRLRVVAAMSGGVDSSVAAALLRQQGYEVIGIMLHLWTEPGKEAENRCCAPDAVALARRVAAMLDIPFYVMDAREQFRQAVVQGFIEGYQNNLTPNPCILCNRTIRWSFLYQQALDLGASFFATGHYARILQENGLFSLHRAADRRKDQSYVLHSLTQDQLAHTLLPLGDLDKSQVRQLARQLNLPVAERPDSQDLCFIPDGDYRAFLSRISPQVAQPGPILNTAGRQIGTHHGLAFYTIGQRKGLMISSPYPLYVLGKDARSNALVVGNAEEQGASQFEVQEASWVSGSIPGEALEATVKIRYKSGDHPCRITPLPANRFRVDLQERLRDITPGQYAVFYKQDVCLGGGMISP